MFDINPAIEAAKQLAERRENTKERILFAAFLKRTGRKWTPADHERLSSIGLFDGRGHFIALDGEPLVGFVDEEPDYSVEFDKPEPYVLKGCKVRYAYAPTLEEMDAGVGARLDF